MAATIVSFRWLDLLEKEFDKSFVDLDLLIGDLEDAEDTEWLGQVRSKLGALSSCFAQLAHKSQTIFQTNAKLEAELLNIQHELAEEAASKKILKQENYDMLRQLHASQLKLHRSSSFHDSIDGDDTEKIRERLEKELDEERVKRLSLEIPKEELVILRRENEALKKYVLNLQGELSGAKLTSKYLDKELAGRIQQLQLLSREWKGEQHEKLWKQLEAEINLHRHKTIVRACRTSTLLSPQAETRNCLNGGLSLPKPLKSQQQRVVHLYRQPDQELGMSVTGGREHGVPILISVLNSDLPAGACQKLFVGDAILSVNGQSLIEASHVEAVKILSAAEGEITLEVVFVTPDEEDELSTSFDEPLSYRFRMFDDEVASVTSSLQFLQNGRLSRASIDSIRGSTDNILESPRHLSELQNDVESQPVASFPDEREAQQPQNNSAPDLEDSLSEHSCCLGDNEELRCAASASLRVNDAPDAKDSDDGFEQPLKETSHLIAGENAEILKSMKHTKKTEEEPSKDCETAMIASDVFNYNY